MAAVLPTFTPAVPAAGDETTPPPGFARAREIICDALAQAAAEEIPAHSLLAAVTVELVPRLVELYGPRGAAHVLGTLTHTVLDDATRQ
jgi:hypothetical protein